MNTAYKIFITVIKNRLESYAEKTIGNYQAGFRPKKSTMDQLFTVRQLLQKCWEFDIDVWQLFVDFRQAYDSINRNALCKIMSELGVPSKLVRITKSTMCNTKKA